MKTIIAATIAVALSAPAFAADLGGMKDNTTAGNTYQSVSHSWSGPYIGVHGGYGWNSHDVQTTHTETVPGTPASCKVSATMGDDGKCYTTIKTPAVPASCKDGYGMKEGQCYTIEKPAKPESCSDEFGNDYSLVGGKCYAVLARDTDGNPTILSGQDSPSAHHNAEDAVLGSEVIDTALNQAQEAKTEKVEDPNAYIPAVDASTTVTNLLQSIDTDGLFGGARVGADYQPSGSRLVFGVLGDFNFADNKQLNEELGITIHDKNSYLLAGRLGVVANDKTLVYGLVGYGWQNVSYAGDEDAMKKTFGHVVAGGGVEYKFTDNLSARLEAQHWFETTKTLVNEDDFTAKDSRSDTRVLVGVNWRPEIN